MYDYFINTLLIYRFINILPSFVLLPMQRKPLCDKQYKSFVFRLIMVEILVASIKAAFSIYYRYLIGTKRLILCFHLLKSSAYQKSASAFAHNNKPLFMSYFSSFVVAGSLKPLM